jgi:hypothetical protein
MRKYSNTPQQGTDVLGLLKRVYGEGASNLESVVRGSAAAIPGFAGDIGQGFDIRGLRSLPTTEQILSKIPRATRPTKEGAGFEEVGTYLPLPISPGTVKQGAQAVQRGMKAAAPYAARSAVNLAEKYGVAPTMSVVKPQGNLNLTPVLSKEILRGPDVQPVESFLSQAKSTPGVTKDAFTEIASLYDDLIPGSKISKADFEARIPPSRYSKVDLGGDAARADDPVEEAMEQAYDIVNQNSDVVYDSVLYRLGVRDVPEGQHSNYLDALHRYHTASIGPEELPDQLRRALERDGMIEDPELYYNLVGEEFDQAVRAEAQDMAGHIDVVPQTRSGYRNEGYQRLLPSNVRDALDEENYFEFGVTHPDRAGLLYKHYTGYESDKDGLVGHVRGTRIPAMRKDAVAYGPGIGKDREVIQLKPNSVIIEEIQSDVQKASASYSQTGDLRQVHGTLFKAAIQDAIHQGASTVYYPTANTIASVRGGNPKRFASIYDQQIMREGLKPLSKIPGVEINPIETMVRIGDRPPESVIAYYEINFTPEAKKYIMSGPGQGAPGYAAGGLVAYDPDEISRIAEEAVQGFAGGGIVKKVVKGLGEFVDKYSAKEADKNLNKFLAPSAVKGRLYHGTNVPEGVGESGVFEHPTTEQSGIHWFSQNPKLADKYTSKYMDYEETGAIFPVHLQAKKPLTIPFNMNERASKKFKDFARELGVYPEEIRENAEMYGNSTPTKVWQFVNTPEFREAAARRGYDSLQAPEGKTMTWGAFDSRQVKSVFNKGTYDTTNPDISKASGGLVKMLSKYLGKETAKEVVKEAPKEQKMLMGVYRGYAGERGAPEEVFATPQRSIADYYAQRRAAELGAEPHAEMLLVDPFAGQQYGLSIPLDKYNREYNFTRARKLKPEDVKDRTPLYAAGGLVNYDPNEIDTIVSQLKEEFHG